MPEQIHTPHEKGCVSDAQIEALLNCKERSKPDIGGYYYDAYGSPRLRLQEIVIHSRMKQSGMENAKNPAVTGIRSDVRIAFSGSSAGPSGWQNRPSQRMSKREITWTIGEFL